MSAWAALRERAHLAAGETVLVNGATGTAGRLAVQLAKHLGAAIIIAIAKTVGDAIPVRFVHVGGASREENIELPGAALHSSAILLMGSGAKSVPLPVLLERIPLCYRA